IWMDDATTGQSQVVRQPGVTGTSLSVAGPLTPGHTYTWWVRPFSDSGVWGPWSSALSFTVAFLDVPAPVGPASAMQNASPTLTWKTVPGADHYDVWVDDLTAPQSQILRSPNVPGTSLTPTTPLSSGHAYEWWVRAVSANGDLSPWSGGTTFTLIPLD